MANVWMYVEKFGRDVLIDEKHPLAVAQRARVSADHPTPASTAPASSAVRADSAAPTDTPPAAAPAATGAPESPRKRKVAKA